MNLNLRARLEPLRSYVLRVRRSEAAKSRRGSCDIRLAVETPKNLWPMWPCKCGGEHPLLYHQNKGTSKILLRCYAKETSECGPIVSLREIAEFFGEPGRSHGRSIVKINGKQFFVCTMEDVDLDEYTVVRPDKKQPALNTPHKLKAQPARTSQPKKSGLTAYEHECLKDLMLRYSDEELYRILKAGGTPDFHVQMLKVIGADDWPDWATIAMIECKAKTDRLAKVTQHEILRGLHNAYRLGIPPKITLYEYESVQS